MNRLRSDQVQQLPPAVLERQSSIPPSDNPDDDEIFTKNDTHDDHQAHIRRRAPTRHSIKSLSGRKTLSKQTSTTEVIHLICSVIHQLLFVLLYIYASRSILRKREIISSGVRFFFFLRLFLI